MSVKGAGNEILEGTGFLVFFVVCGVVLLVYLAVKNLSIPDSLYPQPLASNFASGWDDHFWKLPSSVQSVFGSIEKQIDKTFAAVIGWIDENMPQTSERKSLTRTPEERDASLTPLDADYSGAQEEQGTEGAQ